MPGMSSRRPRIGLLTYERFPQLPEDDRRLLPYLDAGGVDAVPVVWTDDAWRSQGPWDLFVVRATWDYVERLEAFRAFLSAVEAQGIPLANPARTLRRNLDKRYLLELEKADCPIIPTELLTEPLDLRQRLSQRNISKAVIKPVVSANALGTYVVDATTLDNVQARLPGLLAASPVFLQPFMESITDGERSFLFADGQLTHAARKRPKAGDFRVQETYGGTQVRDLESEGNAALVATARKALLAASEDGIPLYGRVDGVLHERKFLLMEVELIEPSLYFDVHPPAAEAFAQAILRRVAFGSGLAFPSSSGARS